MVTTFYLEGNEMNNRFLETISLLLKDKTVKITIEDILDENDFIESNPTYKALLDKSIAELRAGNVIEMNLDDLK